MKLSKLLEFGKENYNELKLDSKIKDKILEKTIYKQSIFSKVAKYFTPVIAIFAIFIIYQQFISTPKQNIEKANINIEQVKITDNLPLKKEKSLSDTDGFNIQRGTTIQVAGAEVGDNYDKKNIYYLIAFVSLFVIFIIFILYRKKKK